MYTESGTHLIVFLRETDKLPFIGDQQSVTLTMSPVNIWLTVTLVLSFVISSQCDDAGMGDAFIETCDKVKTDEQAKKVLECTAPPPEVRAHFKKCFQHMRGRAASKNGKTPPQKQEDMTPLNELRVKCGLMKMRRSAQRSSKGGAPPPPPKSRSKRQAKVQDEQAMNKETMAICKPDDKLKGQMKAHYDKIHSKEGQTAVKQCLKSAVP